MLREGRDGAQGSQPAWTLLLALLSLALFRGVVVVVSLPGEPPVEGKTEVWDSMSGTSLRYTGLRSLVNDELGERVWESRSGR